MILTKVRESCLSLRGTCHFLGGINQGDVEIIAISAARLAQKLNEETRSVEGRKDPVLKHKRDVTSNLAKKLEPYFLAKGVERDKTGRLTRVVESWVRDDYWKAIDSPNWLPNLRILAPSGIGKLPTGVDVSPVAPGKN